MAAKEKSMKVHNRLAELRTARGLSAVALATTIGVGRQTVYAIESGDYAPNTAVALKLAQASIAVVSLALWEEGLVVASGNPKQIRSVADLGRSDVTIVNRERGAGSRLLLDAQLRRLGISHARLRGYESVATGHLPAARRVQTGEADCCIAVSSVARVLGLGFIPLASERYDLVVHRRHMHLPHVQALFNTLALASYRRVGTSGRVRHICRRPPSDLTRADRVPGQYGTPGYSET